MSAGSSSLGQRVLVLKTDASQLRQGLSDARALTIQQTAKIKNDAKIQLQADLLKLKSDFQAAQREATTAKRLIEIQSRYELSINLAQYKSDLRAAEREQAASLKRMQQEARQSQQSGGGALSGLGGALLQGVGIGTGIGLVTQGVGAVTGAIKAGTSAILDYNASLESSAARIRGFTGSQQAVAEAQRIANRAVEQGRGGYAETLSALADLTPLARTYNANLEDLLRTTQLLAATDPAQGFEGAATAIREALSGDFVSLEKRFEIPRAEINKLKAEGVPNLEIVQRALAKLGINDSLLTQQANTFTQQLKIAKDNALRTLADLGAPLADLARDALKGFTAGLSSGDIKAALAGLAADVRGGVQGLRDFFGDKDIQQAIRGMGRDLADSAKSLGTLAALAGPLVSLGKAAAGVSNFFHDLGDDLIGLEKRFDGSGIAAQTLLDILSGKGPFALLDAIKEFNAVITGPNMEKVLNRFLPGAGPGQGALAIPTIAQVFPGFETRPRGGARDEHITPEQISGSSAPVAPHSPAVAPESESQFDSAANAATGRRYAALFAAGKADLQSYIAGFSSSDIDIFGKLAPQIKASFEQAFGGLDIGQQLEHGLTGLDVLTARIVDDIKRTGSVTAETAAIVRATLGDEAGAAVLGLANAYGTLQTATEHVASATADLKEKQRQLTEAQKVATQHADESRAILDGYARDQKANSDAADAAARGYAARLDELGRSQSALNAQAEETARGYQAQLDALQAERDEVTRLTEAHQREYQAQIDGLAAVQNAKSQDATVKGLEVKQRADLLALDERIRAARRAGDEKGARALEDERKRVQARGNYQLDLERERAGVANDQADAAKKPIEDAAKIQADKDKAAGEAIDARIKGTQDEAKAAADDYAARGRALAAQSAALQQEAQDVAADYAARGRAIQANIDKETERARIVAIADNLAVSAAQTRVDRATDAKTAADGELNDAQLMITALQGQNTALATRISDQKAFIQYLQGLGIDVAKYFNGTGATGVGLPAPPGPIPVGPPPGPTGQPDTTRYADGGPITEHIVGVGLASGRRYEFGEAGIEWVVPGYRAPVPPSNGAGYARAGGAGAAGGMALRPGGVTVNGPLVSLPGMVVRETADVDAIIARAADQAQREILGALNDDERAGGLVTSYTG